METTTLEFMPNQHELKALTWKQPFAELMLHGKIETRTWRTHYRGWVLICAGAQPYNQNQIKEIANNPFKILTTLGIGHEPLVNGKAIAIGKLVDCRPMTPEDAEKCFVSYRDGLWCHIYENVKPIKPIKWKGSQGWRTVALAIKQQIKVISK